MDRTMMTGCVQLTVLGGFQLLYDGEPVLLPLGAQRLLGYLALVEGGAQRTTASEALWPDRQGDRSAANLRSALWQARSVGAAPIIDCVETRLRLADPVRVDLREALRWGHEVTAHPKSAILPPGRDVAVAALAQPLMPDWSDDWLLFERERWNQVRVHTLEVLTHSLIATEEYLAALEAAMTAVSIEPVRESANRAVMQVHIAEGNSACAVVHYQRYRGLLQRELGVVPTIQMDRLVRPLV
jgi:DNA-binding SARP family transcriptional activator